MLNEGMRHGTLSASLKEIRKFCISNIFLGVLEFSVIYRLINSTVPTFLMRKLPIIYSNSLNIVCLTLVIKACYEILI